VIVGHIQNGEQGPLNASVTPAHRDPLSVALSNFAPKRNTYQPRVRSTIGMAVG